MQKEQNNNRKDSNELKNRKTMGKYNKTKYQFLTTTTKMEYLQRVQEKGRIILLRSALKEGHMDWNLVQLQNDYIRCVKPLDLISITVNKQ